MSTETFTGKQLFPQQGSTKIINIKYTYKYPKAAK